MVREIGGGTGGRWQQCTTPFQGQGLHRHLTTRWLHFSVNIQALKEAAHPEAP